MRLVNLIPITEIDFPNQDAFDNYNKQHDLRPTTKVTIAGKTTTAGAAAKNSQSVKGKPVFDKGDNKQSIKKKEKYKEDEVKPVYDALSKHNIFSKFGSFNPSQKDIANFANKYKIDISRVLTNPEKFIKINGGDSAKEDDEMKLSDEEYVLNKLGWAMYEEDDWNPNGKTAKFKSAYPLKYKSLSDDEIEKQIKIEKESKDKVAIGLNNFKENEKKVADNVDEINKKNTQVQSDWVKNSLNKNKNYDVLMYDYQVNISKKALNKIDEILKSDPPPPISANALYRGMAMKPKDFKSFMNNFSEGKDVKLPISSFSLDPSIATSFADNINNGNTKLGESNNQSVIIKVVNKNNSFNGFSMNSNVDKIDPYKVSGEWDIEEYEYQQEILMPSNNNYKVTKLETKNMEDDRTLTIITLEQMDSKNEIKLKELIDDTEPDSLKKHLQYPNRISLLYKKGD